MQAVLNFVKNCSHYIIWNFLKYYLVCTVVQNKLKHTEKFLIFIKKGNLFVFVHLFQTQQITFSNSFKSYLKVPSHQIRLALKWYGWNDFHEYDGKQNFKTCFF
jgi:hypothetical protein